MIYIVVLPYIYILFKYIYIYVHIKYIIIIRFRMRGKCMRVYKQNMIIYKIRKHERYERFLKIRFLTRQAPTLDPCDHYKSNNVRNCLWGTFSVSPPFFGREHANTYVANVCIYVYVHIYIYVYIYMYIYLSELINIVISSSIRE